MRRGGGGGALPGESTFTVKDVRYRQISDGHRDVVFIYLYIVTRFLQLIALFSNPAGSPLRESANSENFFYFSGITRPKTFDFMSKYKTYLR